MTGTAESPALPAELMGNAERYALYRCYSDQGELLYVGTSGELGRRLASHVQKVWFIHVRGITLEWYEDELSALNAERRAIHVEHPKYNVQHRKTTAIQSAKVGPRKQSAPRPRGNWEATRAAALAILRDEPGVSGQELGRRLGKTTRYGCMIKAKLTPSGAGPDAPQ